MFPEILVEKLIFVDLDIALVAAAKWTLQPKGMKMASPKCKAYFDNFGLKSILVRSLN